MRTITHILIFTIGLALPAFALPRVPVEEIIGNPMRYDDVRVKVIGEVTKVESDPASPTGIIYTVQDSTNQVIRVKASAPPLLNSRVYVVGTVTQEDGASKPYLVELKHGDPGPALPLLLGAGGILIVAALVLSYFIFVPKPVLPKKQQSAGEPEVERQPIITQVFRDDPVAVLIAVAGPHKGETFNLYSGANTIGRDDNQTVQLSEDSTISRSHARIAAGNGGLTLINESTTNPTRIDGQEVVERELTDGDIIQVGSTRLKVSIVTGD